MTDEMERLYKENLPKPIAKRWDIELKDDNSETGGIAYSGQTLGDFLMEIAEYEEILGLTVGGLNEILKECGIKTV